MDFNFYARIFLRRLHWVILFFLVCSAAGVWLAMTLPPVYQAQARLIVESEQIPDELAASTVQTAATEQIQIIQQRILTRAVLLELANRMDIYANAPQMPAGNKVDDLRNRIEIRLQGGAGGRRGGRQATLLNVSFSAPNAPMAAGVANEIVTLILQENTSMRQTVSGQTLQFFTQEVERLDQELSRLSSRMLAFQEENLDALPDSLDFRRSRQAGVQERLAQLDRDEATLRDRRARLIELFEDTGLLPNAPSEVRQTVEEQQLARLKQEYSNASVLLSEDNPRMAVLQARIDALEKTVAEQRAQAVGVTVTSSDPAAAPPTAFDLQIADIDSQLESIGRRRADLQTQMDELIRTIRATPGNTVALDAMKRDYANLRGQYNQAVANKARAETGDMIETLSKGQRISVIEQAIPPKAPTSPNRPVIAAAGIGGGLALGLAFVLFLELLNRAVRRPVELTNKLGITALATVPYIRTHHEARRRRMTFLVTTLLVAGALAGALWVVDTQVLPLEQAIQRVLERASRALPV